MRQARASTFASPIAVTITMAVACAWLTACQSSGGAGSATASGTATAQGTIPAVSAAPVDATGSATLRWAAPTTRADGSALANVTGYRIYVGKSPEVYSKVIPVADPAATSYTVSNLSSGAYYFWMTTLDATGEESAPSPAVTKTIT